MSDRKRWIVSLGCGAALAFSAAVATADDIEPPVVNICEPVGTVASLSGTATAQSAGSAPRGLACGDSLCAGDSVTTGAGSSAGLLVGDVLTQLDANTTALIGLTPAETVNVELAQGGVRMIDPSSGDTPGRLAAGGAEASVSGNDVEARVKGDPAGQPATFCEWDEPLAVAAGSRSYTVAPGECVVAEPGSAREAASGLNTAPGSAPSIPALAGSCNPDFPISPLAHLDPLPPVAGGPPGSVPPLPDVPLFPPPSPCDDPGVMCAGGGLTEQPPTDDPFPGGGGTFPGGVVVE